MKLCLDALVVTLSALLFTGCQYGPRQDYSKFKTASLIQDGKTVVVTFHDLVYRPAKGIAAFPDGGIPKYITDTSYLCAYDRDTGTLRKLIKAKNNEWSPRNGALHIVTARGNAVLVTQSGQRRDDLGVMLTRHHIVNVDTGKHDSFDLAADLAKHDREPGALYLCDDNGTLLIMTAHPAPPEIWVRRTGGSYVLAGKSKHYQDTVDGDVIYWNQTNRRFYAFNIERNATRQIADYRRLPHKQVTEGAGIGGQGATVDIGVRTNGAWQYTPLPVTRDDIRGL